MSQQDQLKALVRRVPNVSYVPTVPVTKGNEKSGKHPPEEGWRKLPCAHRVEPTGGLGAFVRTGIVSGVFVVDTDSDEAEAWLVAKGVPDTFRVKSGSGRGYHRYFLLPSFLVKCSQNAVRTGIDIRGEGGGVVAPGSPHGLGGTYTIVDPLEVAEAPAWLLAREELRFELRSIVPATNAPNYGEPRESRIARAKAFAAKQDPARGNATPGGSSCTHTMRVFGMLTRFYGLTDKDMILEASQDWNARCTTPDGDPWPWAGEELAHKIDQALHWSPIRWGFRMEDLEELRQWAEDHEARHPSRDVFDEELCAVIPKIYVCAEVHTMAAKGIAALEQAPEIYQREGKLVRIVRTKQKEAVEGREPEGAPRIKDVGAAFLLSTLTKRAQWIRVTKEEEKPARPDDKVVNAIQDFGDWPGVRVLNGIVECPQLRADGSILQARGYDAECSLYYEPGATAFAHVPESPALEDAKRALDELLEPLADFPFDSPASGLVPVAAILTGLAKAYFDGANMPAIVFDATTRGSGKTLLADFVSIVIQGRIASKQDWPAQKEEQEKLLGGIALDGRPICLLDNINSVFGGSPLEARLTCGGRTSMRILGVSSTPELPWRTLVLGSGNNVRFSPDTSRRVLRCRLASDEERPEERTGFKIPNLLRWAAENRPRLVVAGLTLLRAYLAARMPTPPKSWGTFEEWANLVGGSLLWASGIDVTEARCTNDATSDDDSVKLCRVLHAMPTSRTRVRDMLAPGSLEFAELRLAIEEAVPPKKQEGRQGVELRKPGRRLFEQVERSRD